jgi:hypothetical protein
MAVRACYGFEAQQAATDNIVFVGTSSYSTTTVRTGAASLRCNPASGATGRVILNVATVGDFVHFGLNIATAPSLDRVIFGQIAAGIVNVRLTSTGALALYINTTLMGTSADLSTGTWYWIGVRTLTGTSVVFLQIDGLDSVTGTGTVTGTPSSIGCIGTEASAIDIFFDDLIEDTAGFLAPSKVDIALPISDNTRTAVTGGAGGTTNLWDAINNTPPAGVASASETDTTNIKYPASLTEDYLANLETYTTLGIGASDTVLAVQSIVRHGEDIITGTKTLQNVGALTNPTVAGANITAGSDGGAHAAESGANFWVTSFGTVTTSPSVTLGTSPTIRASRISEARVACVDFMGMNVAWTPAAAVEQVPYVNPMPQLLAQ